MKVLAAALLLMLSFESACKEGNWADYYTIADIPIPQDIDPQIGGMTFLRDGRLAVAFHRGEIMLYSPETKKWSRFAHGLHEPLGIVEEASGDLVVMQMPELTRLKDKDKDGLADYYQTLSDQFGLSGNYHEFAFGPAMDSQGNFFVALNVASNYAGIFRHIRGDFSPLGPSRDTMTNWQLPSWAEKDKFKAGRMFSKVNYRGWVLKISPSGKTIPFASGFRSPDGVFVDQQDRLWVTDNQGDWKGTSPLYQVNQGRFYGHPASLVWKPGWKQDPVKMSVAELEVLRTPAVALFPHAELANSPTQPIAINQQVQFGLPENEILIGDMNQARLIRFLEDEVNGTMQGSLIPFLESDELGIGNHRFSFDKSGQLWLGKTHLGWAGGEGIRKVTWRKRNLFLIDQVRQVDHGFDIHFSKPLSSEPSKFRVTSHAYHYHAEYGSEKVDVRQEPAEIVFDRVSSQSISITLDQELATGRVYTIELSNLAAADGAPLMGNKIYYTLNNVKSD